MNARPHASDESPTPRDEKLPRARVLRRRCDIQAVRNTGERRSDRLMTLFALRSPDQPPMAAFQTPKRLGPAVTRNKVRRRMREIFRRWVALPPEWGRVVWTARPAAAGASFEQLRGSMQRLGTRLAR